MTDRIRRALHDAERAFFRPLHDEDPPPRVVAVMLALAVFVLAVLFLCLRYSP